MPIHSSPRNKLPRSSLPMRERPSDEAAGEVRCCVSSDAEGRILTTSFPLFSHPHSIRPVPGSFYLDRFDSENTGTAIAQVGQAGSPVPASQKAENLRFHRWLGQPSSPISSHIAVEGSQESLQYRPSPGISEIRRPEPLPPPSSPLMACIASGKPDRGSPSNSRDANNFLSSSDFSEILCRYEELVARLRWPQRLNTPAPGELSRRSAVQITEDNPAAGFESHERGRLTNSHFPSHKSSPQAERLGQDSPTTVDVGILGFGSMPPSRSPPPALSIQQSRGASDETDTGEAWKTFLFGNEDSDEIEMAAFKEAGQQAARSLRPSDPPVSLDDTPRSDGNSNIATVGTLRPRNESETSESTGIRSLAQVPASLDATYDRSSRSPEEWLALDNPDASVQAPSVEANAGTSSVLGADNVSNGRETPPGGILEEVESSCPASVGDIESRTSELHTRAPSMATSLAVAPARSDAALTETGTTTEQFRFAQPKLFVGSRSNLSQPTRVTGPSVGISLKRKRGRQKKRANDGRADIRRLPNYSSDPIEEFEEETRVVREGRTPKSLFPALELA